MHMLKYARATIFELFLISEVQANHLCIAYGYPNKYNNARKEKLLKMKQKEILLFSLSF